MSTVQLLIDIEVLAHADYMTGTLNSGIPYLVEVQCLFGPRLTLRLLSCWRLHRLSCSSGGIATVLQVADRSLAEHESSPQDIVQSAVL